MFEVIEEAAGDETVGWAMLIWDDCEVSVAAVAAVPWVDGSLLCERALVSVLRGVAVAFSGAAMLKRP